MNKRPGSTRTPITKTQNSKLSTQNSYLVEAEALPGLEAAARADVLAQMGRRVMFQPGGRAAVLRFSYKGDLRALGRLRAVVAVALVQGFAVPRPRALLGHEHLTTLLGLIATVRGLYPYGTFTTLRLSAAGEGSTVLTRLRAELAAATGLQPTTDEGDLLLRLRRAPAGDAGWEVLVRLTPRPLTARPWRVCNRPGALNAVVAHAMNALTRPTPEDRYLNLVCGSGTLLIERLALGPAALALGYDHDPAALACAAANVRAAGLTGPVHLIQAEAGRLPLPAGTLDVLTADLPFGQLVGTHADNARLYPALLQEATRVAAPAARLVLITHEVRLLERLLSRPPLAAAWTTEQIVRITLPFGSGGLSPRIYCLRRNE